jgi:hypothetical protein
LGNETLKLTIGVLDRQWALVGVPVGTSSVCELHVIPSLIIDLETSKAECVYSVFAPPLDL